MRAFSEILFEGNTHEIMQTIVTELHTSTNITPADIHIATLGVLDKLLEQLTDEQIKRLMRSFSVTKSCVYLCN